MLALWVISSGVVALAVIVHYEILFRLSALIPHLRVKHRFRIVLGVIGGLLAHVAEILLFALAYYFMDRADGWGYLQGNFDGSLLDCAYFSFSTFTTLGFGDIEPIGEIRLLTGFEALTGLVLITWTASFLYFEMRRYWDTL